MPPSNLFFPAASSTPNSSKYALRESHFVSLGIPRLGARPRRHHHAPGACLPLLPPPRTEIFRRLYALSIRRRHAARPLPLPHRHHLRLPDGFGAAQRLASPQARVGIPHALPLSLLPRLRVSPATLDLRPPRALAGTL